MKFGTLRIVAITTAAALGVSGCEQLSPGGNAAAFGGGAALLAGGLARAAGMSGTQSMLIGAAAGAAVALTAYVIAKHQATERQHQVAQARARIAAAHIAARRHVQHGSVAQSGGSSRSGSTQRLPRYIAVDTEKDQHTSPKAQKSVMIYDTESQEIVGNNVYDVGKTPQVGSTAKFDTYSAEYVGTGS